MLGHVWDNIFIRMIKIYLKTIVTPSKLLFKSMLEEGTFPYYGEKSNVVPIHKKESKDLKVSSQFLAKFLKDSYLIRYLITLSEINL